MEIPLRKTLQIYFDILKRHKLLSSITVGAVVAVQIVILIQPLLYGNFFNAITASSSKKLIAPTLGIIILQILCFNSLEWLFWRVSILGKNYISPRVGADLYSYCFERIHNHSLSFFSSNQVGGITQKTNRFIKALEVLISEFLWTLLPLAIEAVGIVIIVSQRNSILGLIMFVWVCSFLALNYVVTKYKLKYDLLFNSADSKAAGYLMDTINNSASIKLSGGELFELGAFRKIAQKRFRMQLISSNIGELFEACQGLMVVALEFIIFYFAIKLWQKNQFNVGDFLVVQLYITKLFRKLIDSQRSIRDIYEYLSQAAEMTSILSIIPSIRNAKNSKRLAANNGEIEFRNISFGYSKKKTLFSNFSLAVHAKEKVAIVGPSGSGKSTLIRLLLRFFDIAKGEIFIDGQSISSVSQVSLRKHISFVPQEPVLFHRSILENIRYGKRDAKDEEVEKAARLANCYEFIMKLPQGFRSEVGERGTKLSGGERQRIAIARAILQNAPILVLDEPTSNLDSYSESMIQNALSRLMEGKTSIVIAHRLSTIMKMDRIIVLDQGKIEEVGTHEELLDKNSNIYTSLWNLQKSSFVDNSFKTGQLGERSESSV